LEQQHQGHAVQSEDITDSETGSLSKVPAITLTFWLIKILATTVGETGGDTFSMTLKLGYFESSLIFLLSPNCSPRNAVRFSTGQWWSQQRLSERQRLTSWTAPLVLDM
jgi:hypothetical protein